jgi:hypothetical protein
MRFWGTLTVIICALAASAPAAIGADTLLGGQTLSAGQALISADGRYALGMQTDGNLVFSQRNGTASQRTLWSSGTHGDAGDHALLQTDGPLVLLSPSGQTLWSSNSASAGCTNLVVQDDGNLVIYPSSLKGVWATGNRPTTLNPGDVLLAGQTIYAPGEQYRLVMQSDGNLVLYDDAGAALWSAKTSGHPGSHAVMASTGQLIVEDPAGSPLYSTPTSGHPGANLAVQGDGNLVIYSAGTAIWDTATNATRPAGPLLFHKPSFQACPPPPAPVPPPTPPVATPPPSSPVVSVPVTSPTPRRLRIKVILSWTWNHRTTKLHRIQIPHMPRRAILTVTCGGRGCPRHGRHTDDRHLRRLTRYLDGHAYHAGQRVTLVISERGYRSERIQAQIRDGHLPRVRLLR